MRKDDAVKHEPAGSDDLAERLYVTLHHVGKRLRMLDDDLGLSPVRFSVLGALAFHPPMTVGELARFEHVRSPSMTRLLRDMERDGLVERVPDPADGRRTLVRLTGAGRRLVTTARNRKIAWVAAVLASEDRAGRAAVAHVIAALAPLADDDPPDEDPPGEGPPDGEPAGVTP